MTRYRVKKDDNLSVSHNGKVYAPGSLLPADLTEEQTDGLFETGAIEEVSESDTKAESSSDDKADSDNESEAKDDAASSNPRSQTSKPTTSKTTSTKPATGGKL